MARIKIEDVIEHLDYDMKRALEDAMRQVLPEMSFDRNRLFKAFVRGVRRKCNTWERVPDHLVESD